MNTAINAYTSNYESCYSRDGAAVGAGRNSRRSVREGGERETGSGRAQRSLTLQISVVCALIGLSRPSEPRVALASNKVTRSDCRSDAPARVSAPASISRDQSAGGQGKGPRGGGREAPAGALALSAKRPRRDRTEEMLHQRDKQITKRRTRESS